jgi:hypothetical protein
LGFGLFAGRGVLLFLKVIIRAGIHLLYSFSLPYLGNLSGLCHILNYNGIKERKKNKKKDWTD